MQVKKQQFELDMEQWTGSKLGKKYIKVVYYIVTLLIELLCRVHHVKCQPGWIISWNQDAGETIKKLIYAEDATLRAECEEELKSLLMKEKEESEKAVLKLSIKKLGSWHLVLILHNK